MPRHVYIGTAGWSIPRGAAPHFTSAGSHLERYARVLSGAEINSSFHRPHAGRTYERWASTTPDHFRFAVKVPRTITHDLRLRRAKAPLLQFLAETAGLGEKRGPLLVQLPPSLAFEARLVARFFDVLRTVCDQTIVCEPRHPSWFEVKAARLLERYRIARVAADPPPAPGGDLPGGWPGIVYLRLHGSPRKYWSRYDEPALATLAAAIRAVPAEVDAWCMFDNTASGAALENACELRSILDPETVTPATHP